MKKVKGLRKTSLTDTAKIMVMTRGKRGWGEVGGGIGEVNGDGKRLDWGW